MATYFQLRDTREGQQVVRRKKVTRKICLFDIDGTLIQTGGAGKSAFQAALTSEFGIEASDCRVPFSGRTDRAIVRDLFELHRIDDTEASWDRFCGAYLHHLPAELALLQGRVLPGILKLLAEFSERPDVAVGLLTGNMEKGAMTKLTHFAIEHHFEFGGYGERHYDRADVAREALAAARQNNDNVLTEQVWVIGDTPLDIQCARAIDAHVVAVCTGLHSREELAAEHPDLLLDDLADPTPFLLAIAG